MWGRCLVSDIFASIIPEGINVLLLLYSLFRYLRYFPPIPDRFWPERWAESTHSKKSLHEDQSSPTGTCSSHCQFRDLTWSSRKAIIQTIG